MKMRDLITMLQSGKEVDVEFVKGVEDLECYPETGMRATITGVIPKHDDVLELRVSYLKYDDFNIKFESSNYYDSNQQPVLTAREAGYYSLKESIFVMADDDVEKYMTLLTPNEMFDTWNASLKEVSYVAWLENRVRQLEEHINSVDHLTQTYDNGHIN